MITFIIIFVFIYCLVRLSEESAAISRKRAELKRIRSEIKRIEKNRRKEVERWVVKNWENLKPKK